MNLQSQTIPEMRHQARRRPFVIEDWHQSQNEIQYNPPPSFKNDDPDVVFYRRHQSQPRQGKVKVSSCRGRGFGTPSIFSVIFCLFGASWQLYILTTEYLEYGIISEVFMSKNDSVRIPAMSLCFPYTEVIDWSETEEKVKNKSHPDFTRYVQEKYTASELLQMTPKMEKFLNYAWVRKQNSYGNHESHKVMPPEIQVTRYLKDFYVCYRFMHINATHSDFYLRSHHITFGRKPGMLMGLYFDKKRFKPITRGILYLHPVDIFPRGDRDYPIIMFGNKKDVFEEDSTYWGISYAETSLHLLPLPFATKCINYQEVFGFENEIHCQHHCSDKISTKKFGKSLFTVTSLIGQRGNNIPALSKYSIINDEEKEKEVDEILDTCNRSCPGVNCNRKYFMPTVAVKRDSDTQVIFELYDMNGPEVHSNAHPKLTLISFMIGIISVIGVWMGVSCKDLFMGAFKVTKKYMPSQAVQ